MQNVLWPLELHWTKILPVALEIRKAKQIDENKALRSLLKRFEGIQGADTSQVLQLLSAPKAARARRGHLSAIKHELKRSKTALEEITAELAKVKELLKPVLKAQPEGLPAPRRRKIDRYRQNLERRLEAGKKEYQRLPVQIHELETELREGQAYFARDELLDFCRNQRYELTPLNLAKALAGIPDLRWRRSVFRCQVFKIDNHGSGPVVYLKIITRIVDSKPEGIPLEQHARSWIEARCKRDTPVREFATNFYYLQEAIRVVAKQRIVPYERSFRITEEYSRRLNSKSNTDAVLEVIERINC